MRGQRRGRREEGERARRVGRGGSDCRVKFLLVEKSLPEVKM